MTEQAQKRKLRLNTLLYRVREIIVGWGWHYLGSTCVIGLLAFVNLREGYLLLLFPLSGVIVLIVGYCLPKGPKSEPLD